MSQARFELKYRISEQVAQELQEIARFHLEPDAHSKDGEYIVNSLYFDTPLDEDASETDEGVVLRSKVRLRCYRQSPRPPYFLELKQRYGSSITKTRVLLDATDAERVANGLAPVNAYRNDNDPSALDTIREVIDHRTMVPRMWVKYTRLAWTSPWGDGVRMTFDRAIEAQVIEPCAALAPAEGGWIFPELDDRVVLELKFFGAAPRWMQRLAHDFELERCSCSKYGLGIFSLDRSPVISNLVYAS
ncbi:MAG: polyphosphate polymerase domain-containing protein [Deltaproteobacteria bacterium]|nr:polyphosphate polymerase domain-containing protein [Deltaproteobacteria bacterium]